MIVRSYRLFFGLLALVAMGRQLTVTAANGLSLANFFSYFTIQSNLIAAVVLLAVVVRPSASAEWWRGLAVACMTITGVVFNLLLRGVEAPTIAWVNEVVHVVMPLVMVLDWLTVPPRDPIAWPAALRGLVSLSVPRRAAARCRIGHRDLRGDRGGFRRDECPGDGDREPEGTAPLSWYCARMRFALRAGFVLALLTSCVALPAVAAPDPHALFARERRAVGGDAWNGVAALRMEGIAITGGAPSAFSQLVDHRTGYSISTARVGPVTDVAGFDGVAWDFQGSAVSESTLPASIADAVTQAYAARDGWWNRADPATMTALGASGGDDGVRVVPAGGSPIDVWFDRKTGLIDRDVAHTDTGVVVTIDDDYRTVGDLVQSFHSVQTDPTGAVTIVNARSIVALRSVAANAFARPVARVLGSIAGGAASAVAPFRFDPNAGWITTSIRVGGRPSTIIFDSGGANYFVPAAARRLALRAGGGISIGGVGNGSLDAGLAQLGTIRLGNALLADQHGIVAPLPYVVTHPIAGLDTDGLIGAEFLQNLRIAFDFDAHRMTLTPFARAPAVPARATVAPLLTDGGHAYVRAAIDGIAGYYLLDTGDSGGITVFRRFADAHGLFRGPGLMYISAGGVGGNLAYRTYRARSFALGGAVLHAPPVTVTEASAGSFASRSIAGNIGIRVLSRYALTFDLAHKRVTFVPTARVRVPFPTDHTGMSLTQADPSALVVLSVVPGSPAADAGVTAGTRIIALNGTSVGGAKLGAGNVSPFVRGVLPYTLTIVPPGGAATTVTIHPRVLLK